MVALRAGPVALAVSLLASLTAFSTTAAAPDNDDFEAAAPLGPSPADVTFTTSEATFEPDEPRSCGIENTVWFRLQLGDEDAVAVERLRSESDVVIAVYTGTSLESLDLVACHDDPESFAARVALRVEAGQTYYVQVGNYDGRAGPIQITVEELYPPDNDQVSAARPISAPLFLHGVDTSGASVQIGEVRACSDVAATVWYRIENAPGTRMAAFTFGSNFNTVLGAFLVREDGTMDHRACNTDVTLSPTSINELSWSTIPGETYLLQVGGVAGEHGALEVQIHVRAV